MHVPVRTPSTGAGSLRLSGRALLRSLADHLGAAPARRSALERRPVSWIAGVAPAGEDAMAVHEAIAVRRCRTYGEIARDVAERRYRRDAEAGGWAADIGLFYRRYLAHAARAIDRLDGRAVRIGAGGEQPR